MRWIWNIEKIGRALLYSSLWKSVLLCWGSRTPANLMFESVGLGEPLLITSGLPPEWPTSPSCLDPHLAPLDFFPVLVQGSLRPFHSGFLQVRGHHHSVIKPEYLLPGPPSSQDTATVGAVSAYAQLRRLCQGKTGRCGGADTRPKAGRLTQYLQRGVRSWPSGPQLLTQAGLMVAAQCLQVTK